MKELRIHVRIKDDKIATAVQKKGFDNSASSNLEIIGILQNLIRIEQDKMHTQAQVKVPKGFGADKTKTYDIDVRTVVIQRARVVKGRPKLENWEVSFTLMYNEKLIEDHGLIKQVLEEAGERIGLLDFRPQKLGSFGMFQVTKWLPKK